MQRRRLDSVALVFLGAIVLVLLSAVVLSLLKKLPPAQQQNIVAGNEKTVSPEPTIDTSSWQTYRNDKYEFTLRYPSDWKVYEGVDPESSPIISFYNESAAPTHHYDPATAIVILPEGSLKEGMLCGRNREAKLNLTEPSQEAVDCLLSDGTPWASRVSYDIWTKNGWKGGFIWANTRVAGLSVSQQGDELVRSGKINTKDRVIEEKILESFHFTSQKAKTESWYLYTNPEDGYEIKIPSNYPMALGPVAIGGNLINESSGLDFGTIFIIPGSFTDFSSAVIEISSNASSACKNLTLSVKPIDKKIIGNRTFNKQFLDSDSYMNTVYSINHKDTCYIFNLRTNEIKSYGRDFYELTRVIERMLETLKFMY